MKVPHSSSSNLLDDVRGSFKYFVFILYKTVLILVEVVEVVAIVCGLGAHEQVVVTQHLVR